MSKPRHHSVRSGFTLTELLVAIAVLAIIVVAASQILGTASTLTATNNKHIDADGQARMVLDRMANDFARMVKRADVDFIFCKATGNDTMFFYSEGASYFNTSVYSAYKKNSVSLIAYRINNGSNGLAAAGTPPYGQLERLGKPLSWDSGGSTAFVAYLTYPTAGTAPSGTTYSAANYASTLWGSYLAGASDGTSLVGSLSKNFNDSSDNTYDPIGTNIFRLEFSFQLKDGTQAAIPVMTPSANNAIPSANLSATGPPTATTDSTLTAATGNTSTKYIIGSRWYDTANQVGYICIDATPGYAVWHEIGIQDVAAIVVTVAVIDKQGMVFINSNGKDIVTGLAAQFADGSNASVAQTWTAAITPVSATTKSAVATATGIPQMIVSQIRVYQRFFYISNY